MFWCGRKKTPSQLLTDQAHRVEFIGDKEDGEDGIPAPKRRTAEKWPWESVHTKLRFVHSRQENQMNVTVLSPSLLCTSHIHHLPN